MSSSMDSENKLELLKKSFGLLLDALKPTDRIAIVLYAGSEGLVLPSTEVMDKEIILNAINNLTANASTTGSEGIALAYEIAEEYFIENGNNRIILATNGDFDIESSRTSELVEIIENKIGEGVFLTILDYGNGHNNYNRIENITNKCHGNYFHIDNILEANKVLVTELTGTMFAIAKDVKLQIEFNPVKVASYRLIGYENRLMDKEGFNDNNTDACGIGAGYAVTALYEIVPAFPEVTKKIDDLKYQLFDTIKPNAFNSDELMYIKLSYKEPNDNQSTLIEYPLIDDGEYFEKTSNNFRFAAAVAEFGMLLRESKFKGNSTFDGVIEMAKKSKGKDEFGYRSEFIQLAQKAKLLNK
jgi:Ca-activated chloride channel family protein